MAYRDESEGLRRRVEELENRRSFRGDHRSLELVAARALVRRDQQASQLRCTRALDAAAELLTQHAVRHRVEPPPPPAPAVAEAEEEEPEVAVAAPVANLK